MTYLWIKALHVMAWASWMAGLFYLPRLFVYHAERGTPGGELSETLKVMERKLLRFIMRPAMIVTWATGLWLLWAGGWWMDGWMHAKILLVILMTGAHHMMQGWLKTFEADANEKTGRFYRIMNEVPTLIFIGVVILVIVKPF